MAHRARLLAVLVGLGIGLGGVTGGHAAVVRVANDGVDGPGCGGLTDPCRTITRAIANAVDGDRILVGPGRYGDVDGNGLLSGPEEEVPADSRDRSTISVNKRLTIESAAGAAATVIETIHRDGVKLLVAGTVFGGRSKGFTVRGLGAPDESGITAGGGGNAVTRIVDNVVTGFRNGSGIDAAGDRVEITGNVISESAVGVEVSTPSAVISGNAIVRNSVGVSALSAGLTMQGNLVSANDVGVVVGFGAGTLQRNVILANRRCGVEVTGASRLSVTLGNIFGNGGSTNCGIQNHDTTLVVDATRNYWGSDSGPGANPADQPAGPVDFVPFATRPYSIAVETGR
jgi:hypothetical protein